MSIFKKLTLIVAVLAASLFPAYSQDWLDDLLTRTDTVADPQYMPVVGVGLGYFNFYGNVNDAFRSSTVGQPGYRINVATFLDRGGKRYYRLNFVFMGGSLSGTQRTVNDTSFYKNLNFKSNIFSFGMNFHYSFKHFVTGKYFEPFVSIGIQPIMFDTKADYYYGEVSRYHYWKDGTLRDAPQTGTFADLNANIVSRSYNYDVDLRSLNQSGLGKYTQFAFAMPIDIGIDFNISKRVALRAATSLHYAFTDLIDDKSSKSNNPDIPEYKGSRSFNMFTFSYLSLHLDLFSDSETVTTDLLFADLAPEDLEMWDDEDGDGVSDGWDRCPGTPWTVEVVDSVGCPLDSDNDGIPDYLDREPNSREGAIVDKDGVEISEDAFIEIINNMEAIRRSEVESFLLLQKLQFRTRRSGDLTIPPKFLETDTNKDGYISYDELMKAVNDFFDGKSKFKPSDLNELKDFFFEQ